MSYAMLYVYTTPADSAVDLALDVTGITVIGQGPLDAHGRADAHLLSVPVDAPRQGALLRCSRDGYLLFANRGIYTPPASAEAEASFVLDHVYLIPEPVAPPEPAPGPEPGPTPPAPEDPDEIVQAVYDAGGHDLSTHDGCGQFTEACCTALHDQHSSLWGHIRKDPGQNQYNGHAVDAVMLLAGEGAGIFDIVHDSVSPNATPQYVYKGPPEPDLWYYDLAADGAAGLTMRAGLTPAPDPAA